MSENATLNSVTSSQHIDLKLTLGDVNRKVSLLASDGCPSWHTLVAMIKSRFGIERGKEIGLKYVDDDGDEITLSSFVELQELWPLPSPSRFRVVVFRDPSAGALEPTPVPSLRTVSSRESSMTVQEDDGFVDVAKPLPDTEDKERQMDVDVDENAEKDKETEKGKRRALDEEASAPSTPQTQTRAETVLENPPETPLPEQPTDFTAESNSASGSASASTSIPRDSTNANDTTDSSTTTPFNSILRSILSDILSDSQIQHHLANFNIDPESTLRASENLGNALEGEVQRFLERMGLTDLVGMGNSFASFMGGGAARAGTGAADTGRNFPGAFPDPEEQPVPNTGTNDRAAGGQGPRRGCPWPSRGRGFGFGFGIPPPPPFSWGNSRPGQPGRPHGPPPPPFPGFWFGAPPPPPPPPPHPYSRGDNSTPRPPFFSHGSHPAHHHGPHHHHHHHRQGSNDEGRHRGHEHHHPRGGFNFGRGGLFGSGRVGESREPRRAWTWGPEAYDWNTSSNAEAGPSNDAEKEREKERRRERRRERKERKRERKQRRKQRKQEGGNSSSTSSSSSESSDDEGNTTGRSRH